METLKEEYYKINGEFVTTTEGEMVTGTHLQALLTYDKGYGYKITLAPVRIIADGIVICRFIGVRGKIIVPSTRKSAKKAQESIAIFEKDIAGIIAEFFKVEDLHLERQVA